MGVPLSRALMSGYSTATAPGWLYTVRVGQPVQAEAGLEAGLFPITVTGVRVLGPPGALRVIKVARGSGPVLLSCGRPTSYPVRVAARNSLWIGYAVALRRCPGAPAGITRVRISYRELGFSLTQTVPLASNNTLLTCQ